MKIYNIFKITCICLLILSTGCAGNLEKQKSIGKASRNVGEAYLAQDNYSGALKEFLKAEKLYPNDHILQNDLGYTYRAKGKLDLAIKHFEKAIQINPDYAPAKNNMGETYMIKGDWDKAISIFKELSEDLLYATPHYPMLNLGCAYFNKKEYEKSEAYYNNVLRYYQDGFKKDVTYIKALRGLSQIYLSTERINEAKEILEMAVKDYPKVTALHLDLAYTYTLSQEYKKALESLDRVIQLSPDSSLAKIAKKEAEKINRLQPQ